MSVITAMHAGKAVSDASPQAVAQACQGCSNRTVAAPQLLGAFSPGEESLEVQMFSEEEIPWDDIAFHSGRYALKKYFEDRGQNNGAHVHELRRARS